MGTFRAAIPLAATLTLAASASTASAQPATGRAGGRDRPPMVLEKEQLGTSSFAQVARARMRNGDCAGALDEFDASIAHSIDPTLRRDRGLCHEQLGDPYPAMDDYRAYLTADPDAPDAESIRGRLARLEQQTTGKSSRADDDDVPPASKGGAGASASITVGTAGASASGDASSSGAGSAPRSDPLDYVEHDNDQFRSPLRRGTGWSLEPYFSEHKWFTQNTSFGESDTWAECIGVQFRYSFGHVVTLFLEGAYEHFNSTSSSTDTTAGDVQGLTSQLGLELRFPLDTDYNNQLFVGPGIGFDHIVASGNGVASPTVTAGAIIPRARFGWRHLFDASGGMDISLDAGAGKFATYDNGDFPFGGSSTTSPLLALNIGLVWGL